MRRKVVLSLSSKTWYSQHFDLQAVAEQIPLLVQGVRGSQAQPDSPSAQLALIAASQSFLQARHSPLLRPRPPHLSKTLGLPQSEYLLVAKTEPECLLHSASVH